MSWKVLSTNKIKEFGPYFPLFADIFSLSAPNNDASFSPHDLQKWVDPPNRH
jgi:hypothetical protein